jgi:hypothetical protein
MSGDSGEQWVERTKRFFKAELKRADVTYHDLAERLSKVGVSETNSLLLSC